ncbi:MAG: alpha/beta fold hydrolase [Bacteroidaceae bacterium]|nr:alpha/beta fold hydrolase [Bacteroidaceae bacterium]
MKKLSLAFFLVVACLSMSSWAQVPAGRMDVCQMPCRLLDGITQREFSIYLPPSYSTDTLRRYPVVYLLHGGGESHSVWQRMGHLTELANRLIGEGQIQEAIFVCPEANQQNMMYFNAPQWRYEDYFFQEFIPYIEKNYRTRTDKGGRAVAGFSMGGGAATVYGVHHPEQFALVYDISGYLRRLPLEWLKNDPSAEWRQQVIEDNSPIRRVAEGTEADAKAWQQVDWAIRVGDHDFTLGLNAEFAEALRNKKIPYSMQVSGGDHNWEFVTPALEDAMRRADALFYENTPDGGRAERHWVQNGSRQIYGLLSRPAKAEGRQPLVIVSHGFNGTHHYGRNYFRPLNDLGYQVYAFDFACGSVNSRSDNNTMNMSVFDEQSDLEAIVHHFQQQPDVDPQRIVLLGESQGGLVSALTAAALPKEICKLVLVYPALCIPDNWNERYPDVTMIPDTTLMWGVPLGRRFFLEVRDLKVFKTIGRYRGPAIIVQGDADQVVSMDDSRRAVKLYKKANLYVIPGAGHGFKPQEFAKSMEYISAFLK